VHIGAAGKGAAVAADDRDLRLRVEIEAAQRIRQMPHQLVAICAYRLSVKTR
jgi:hypothetical protein